MPRPLVQKKTWRVSLPIDMLLSAVSVLVVAKSSSEIPEGLMNNPVFRGRSKFSRYFKTFIYFTILCEAPVGSVFSRRPS